MHQTRAEKNTKENRPAEKDNVIHTGSGGAFEETEHHTEETFRELSDKQLDERLENEDNNPKKNKGKAY